MAAPTLPELQEKAVSLGIVLNGNETKAMISEMIIAKSQPIVTPDALIDASTPPSVDSFTVVPDGEKVVMMKVSDIQKLIADAIIASKETNIVKPKKVTEHTIHVWRLDGKWVVDFKDRNDDEYFKGKVHSFQKFNEQRREFEAWIELVLEDLEGNISYKEMPLQNYVKHRHLVYCPLVKRHLNDKSYIIGEVELKKDNSKGDGYVGTGKMIDQSVEQYETTFEVRLPTGQVKMLPEYVIA